MDAGLPETEAKSLVERRKDSDVKDRLKATSEEALSQGVSMRERELL